MTDPRPASLAMYDADRGAVQRFWAGLAHALRAKGLACVPEAVDWPADLDAHWQHPRLLLAQTCGHPLRTRLAGRVQVVGAFRYAVPGCSGIHYRSELVVRRSEPGQHIADFRGGIAAFNDARSYSGWQALRALVAPLAADGAFFGASVATGSHRASLAALQVGRADIAAIDCVTLAGLQRHEPALLDGLRVIGHTAPAPGLPLITAAATPAAELAALRRALAAACADPGLATTRETLFIAGFTAAPAAAWLPRTEPDATSVSTAPRLRPAATPATRRSARASAGSAPA